MRPGCPTRPAAVAAWRRVVAPATSTGADDDYRKLSFWHDTVPGTLTPGRPAGRGHRGGRRDRRAGLHRAVDGVLPVAAPTRSCGSWSASARSPDSAPPGATAAGARRCSPRRSASWRGWPAGTPAIAMYRAMQQTVDEVGKVAAAEGIDCHWAKGGTVQLARRRPAGAGQGGGRRGQALRLRRGRPAAADRRGGGELGGAPACSAATYTPHCAAIHPARLARGLAGAVARARRHLFERTEVRQIKPGGWSRTGDGQRPGT